MVMPDWIFYILAIFIGGPLGAVLIAGLFAWAIWFAIWWEPK